MDLMSINSATTDMFQKQSVTMTPVQPQQSRLDIQPTSSSTSSQSGGQDSSKEQTKNAIDAINKTMASMSRSLEFAVDDDVHMTIVKVVDTQTHDVIRQIPSEEVVAIAKALDKIQGLLIKQQV
ncbi:flagellar protein FlaG [Novimethylophilus kurashikiensis]|uniref:Flagellar protein FlaG n=1 Tax=Novimethylophilus kurashikiensis TaxID=1825523 RepID=A0A2R5F4U1_9PROT|nr:flagellar protein FlaG [Novimethylophilus kurashikiensis]GBG12999.1 flagellar protein FlaG [Novimethylophilus kurashikiensis]